MKSKNVNPKSKHNLLSALAFLAIIVVIVVAMGLIRVKPVQGIISAVADVPPPPPTAPLPTPLPQSTPAGMADCPAGWDKSTNASVRDTCEKRKADSAKQQQAADIATMQAQPYVQTMPNFTPVTLLPVPDEAKTLKELKFDPDGGPWPFQWIGATSVWRIGSVANAGYTSWDELYLVAYQGNGVHASDAYDGSRDIATSDANPVLATMVFSSVADVGEANYNKRWTFPKAVSEVYITSVTRPDLNITDASTPFPSLQGTIYFKTKDGQTGKFDMATEVWTFDTP